MANSRACFGSGAAACLSLITACASSVSTLEPAKTVEPGRMELVAGASLPIHGVFVTSMAKAISRGAGRLSDANTDPITPEERSDLDRAALAAVLLQPAIVPELKGRLGVVRRVDVGLRYAGPAFKFDVKYNFWGNDAFDLALSAGYVHHTGIAASFAKAAFELFDDLKLVEYSRRDLDFALLLSGAAPRKVFPYGAVRWVIGMPHLETKLPPEFVSATGIENTKVDSSMHYFGATGGIRAGGAKVAFLGELTLMYLVFNPTVLDERVSLSGLVIAPAAALDVRF